jgi:hypothetical protein
MQKPYKTEHQPNYLLDTHCLRKVTTQQPQLATDIADLGLVKIEGVLHTALDILEGSDTVPLVGIS